MRFNGTRIFLNGLGLLLTVLMWQSAECCEDVEQSLPFPNSDVYIRLVRSTKLQYQLLKGSNVIQTISLDDFSATNQLQPTSQGFSLSDGTTTVNFQLITSSTEITHVRVARENIARSVQITDCVELDIAHTNWYGGPEDTYQYWPVQRQSYNNYSYVTNAAHHAGIIERYWLSSKGVIVYVEEETPLFINQNTDEYRNQLCFSAIIAPPYNIRLDQHSFVYHVAVGKNPRIAHMYGVNTFLGIPTSYPDERMAQHPIWSTWALYKRDITNQIVLDFAYHIRAYGFQNSQLEIDDNWEECYGSFKFNKTKFPNITELTDYLKTEGFRVTLWIHPFINKDCTAIYNEAKANGYLVLDHNGNTDTQWWDSSKDDAAYIDFTKPEVQQWFTNRLKRLQMEDGIDSFKFDAGETSWLPNDPVLQGNRQIYPNQITTDYVRTVSKFGPMIEVRSGMRTQGLPIFVRMLDKDSQWGWNNGLITIITTLLQMNLNGYPFVLPDMIGGNGYNNNPPSKELFIRWLQANVFMPSLQFSYVPWYFDQETVEISKKFTQLHSKYTPYIMKRFKLATATGEPVNPPLWWADPEDTVAHSIYDEFLLGDDIIAAPVVQQGATNRDIYLPKGQWKDGNTNISYIGPTWLMGYSAPLDILPYFERIVY